jgi:hypothetical protein
MVGKTIMRIAGEIGTIYWRPATTELACDGG